MPDNQEKKQILYEYIEASIEGCKSARDEYSNSRKVQRVS